MDRSLCNDILKIAILYSTPQILRSPSFIGSVVVVEVFVVVFVVAAEVVEVEVVVEGASYNLLKRSSMKINCYLTFQCYVILCSFNVFTCSQVEK